VLPDDGGCFPKRFVDGNRSRKRKMKKIEAIIYPFKFKDVKAALERVGIEGFLVLEVYSCGDQKSLAEAHQGGTHVAAYERKLKVEIVVVDYKAVQVSEALKKAARTGRIGDGAILILPMEEIVRIRTGERGSAAIC
jgi:nitrogen regulatory protein P-II 1